MQNLKYLFDLAVMLAEKIALIAEKISIWLWKFLIVILGGTINFTADLIKLILRYL